MFELFFYFCILFYFIVLSLLIYQLVLLIFNCLIRSVQSLEDQAISKTMKTHINNTKAIELFTDHQGKEAYAHHQYLMSMQKIKPVVSTHRKEIKVSNNNKLEINQQPQQQVNKLFQKIISNNYKSTLDNKAPTCYESGKKLLKDRVKKNKNQNYIQKEHERQLKSQAHRIENCKSLAQRKKDKTDPIVNPTYFMRDGDDLKSVTIENYKSTVLHKNRPKSGCPSSISRKEVESRLYGTHNWHDQKKTNAKSIVDMSRHSQTKMHPKSANQRSAMGVHSDHGLPECTFKSILSHIVDNKLYKDVDLKVLYVRLCHKHGDERVDELWEDLMAELQA